MNHYERQIQAAMRTAAGDDDWSFTSVRVGSLRSPDPADIRVPDRLRRRGPGWLLRGLTRPVLDRTLTHRFDLRLPPAPREIVTAHDLPPLHFDDEGLIAPWSLESVRRALQVIVPSSFAASEIQRFCSTDDITVIPYGLTTGFLEATPADEDLLSGLGIRKPFLVHAAGATRRKNLHGLAEGWARTAKSGVQHQLVLCGPPHPNRDRAFSGASEVVMLGRQPLEIVASLMAASDGVVVPSLYEGFGLPALEGMAAGVPVLAADAGALPEVCGDSAILVDPSGEGLADGLGRLMGLSAVERKNLGQQGRQRAATFDWAKAAHAHLDVYGRFL